MRTTFALALLATLSFGTAAQAFDSWDMEERRRHVLEMDQVNRHDYTYQVHPNGTISPRYDRYSNKLRATRDPRTLRFPAARPADVKRRYAW